MPASSEQVPATVTNRRGHLSSWRAYLYVLPALAFFLLFLGLPMLQTLQYSFYNWNGLGTATAAGLRNYINIPYDSDLRSAFLHSLVLMVFYALVPVILGLFLTALISRAHDLRVMSLFRVILFLPQVIASVVVGTIWVSIYSTDGLLNQVLRGIGLGSQATTWLGDYNTALVAIGLIGTWLNTGLAVVFFLSGLGNVHRETFEAARMDGAGLWREFGYVALPALRGQIAIALTLTVVSALKTFDLVYVTTRGGPGTSTIVPAFEIYNLAFNTGQVGAAAALAVVLVLLIMAVTALISRVQPKDVA